MFSSKSFARRYFRVSEICFFFLVLLFFAYQNIRLMLDSKSNTSHQADITPPDEDLISHFVAPDNIMDVIERIRESEKDKIPSTSNRDMRKRNLRNMYIESHSESSESLKQYQHYMDRASLSLHHYKSLFEQEKECVNVLSKTYNVFDFSLKSLSPLQSLLNWKPLSSSLHHDIGICTIIRNEAMYLDEWIAFHWLQGIRLFIIYDDLSSDHPRDILQKYMDMGLVIYSPISPDHPLQGTEELQWIKMNECFNIMKVLNENSVMVKNVSNTGNMQDLRENNKNDNLKKNRNLVNSEVSKFSKEPVDRFDQNDFLISGKINLETPLSYLLFPDIDEFYFPMSNSDADKVYTANKSNNTRIQKRKEMSYLKGHQNQQESEKKNWKKEILLNNFETFNWRDYHLATFLHETHDSDVCIYLQRTIFGTSFHHLSPTPPGKVIDNYFLRSPVGYDGYPKVIVNLNPHFSNANNIRKTKLGISKKIEYEQQNGKKAVDSLFSVHSITDEDGSRQCVRQTKVDDAFEGTYIRVNHYFRSIEEFDVKLKTHYAPKKNQTAEENTKYMTMNNNAALNSESSSEKEFLSNQFPLDSYYRSEKFQAKEGPLAFFWERDVNKIYDNHISAVYSCAINALLSRLPITDKK